MEHENFDQIVRAMADGFSRRSVLRRAASSAIASPLALFGVTAAHAQGKDKGKEKDKGNQGRSGGGGCRDVGHPCEGNQVCCEGLVCGQDGPGNAMRCSTANSSVSGSTAANQTVVTTNNQVCAGDCAQTTQQVVQLEGSQPTGAGLPEGLTPPPTYWIDVTCDFDAARYRSRCACTGRGAPEAPPIRTITLSPADICAVVISEETRVERERVRPRDDTTAATGGQASAGTGGVANAEASGGSVTVGDVRGADTDIAIDASGGTASADASGGDNNVAIAGGGQVAAPAPRQVELTTLVLDLEGNVGPGRPTTYWVETDAGRRPASGPALVQVADEDDQSGAIIAEARQCSLPQPQPNYDWFGQCTEPVTDMRFSVYPEAGGTTPVATMQTNAQGRARFGNLPPGTYQIRPEGALGDEGLIWCYAESDRVDANGNILVEANRESHLWSFTCNPSG